MSLLLCFLHQLRFEIERDILAGKMSCADFPKVWNAKMKEYLGLDVPSDSVGCLQGIIILEAFYILYM